MKLLFFGLALTAFGLANALRVPPRDNAVQWFELAPAKKLTNIPANETKPLLGNDDGHELTDIDHEHMSAWNEFKAKFQRAYANFEEELMRFKIFVRNLLFVYEHNKLYREGKSSFEVGINEYADLVSSELGISVNVLI